MCGKNRNVISQSRLQVGTPPRVREKLGYVDGEDFNSRITPACAGKTLGPLGRENNVRDHPRVCGKNHTKIQLGSYGSGSPPRVREKLVNKRYSMYEPGITPACAGKTKVEKVQVFRS